MSNRGRNPIIAEYGLSVGDNLEFYSSVASKRNITGASEISCDVINTNKMYINQIFVSILTGQSIHADTITGTNKLAVPLITGQSIFADTITGTNHLFIPSITGQSLFVNTITGTNRLFIPSITGQSLFVNTITGTNRLFIPIISGQSIFADTITGTNRLFIPSITGQSIFADTITGTNRLAVPLITGQSIFADTITGTNRLFIPSITGQSLFVNTITGTNRLFIPSITGQSIFADTITGTNRLAVPLITGQSIFADTITGTNRLAVPLITGQSIFADTITGTNRLFIPSITGQSIFADTITGTNRLAVPLITGQSIFADTITGTNRLFIPSITGQSLFMDTITGTNRLAVPLITGQSIYADTITGTNRLFIPSITGQSLFVNTITGTNRLFIPSITGQSIFADTITGTNRLFIPSITGQSIFADTITGTRLFINSITGQSIFTNTITGVSFISANVMYTDNIYLKTPILSNTVTSDQFVTKQYVDDITNGELLIVNLMRATILTGQSIYADTITGTNRLFIPSITGQSIFADTITGTNRLAVPLITCQSIFADTITGTNRLAVPLITCQSIFANTITGTNRLAVPLITCQSIFADTITGTNRLAVPLITCQSIFADTITGTNRLAVPLITCQSIYADTITGTNRLFIPSITGQSIYADTITGTTRLSVPSISTNNISSTTNVSGTPNLALSTAQNTSNVPIVIEPRSTHDNFQTLVVRDASSGNYMAFIPRAGSGNNGTFCFPGDCQIASLGSMGGQPLTIMPHSNTTVGIRLTGTSALIGAGGTAHYNPTSSLLFSGTTATMTGSLSCNGAITLNGATAGDRAINNTNYNLNDINNNYIGRFYSQPTVLYLEFHNTTQSFTIVNTNAGTPTHTPFQINPSNLSISTTNCPTMTYTVLPATTDNSYKVATTNWVQTALTSGVATATTVQVSENNTNSTFYPVFTTTGAGQKSLSFDPTTTALSYNPSTSTLTASIFSGSGSGLTSIPIAGVVGTAVNLSDNQTITGIKTFSHASGVEISDGGSNKTTFRLSAGNASVFEMNQAAAGGYVFKSPNGTSVSIVNNTIFADVHQITSSDSLKYAKHTFSTNTYIIDNIVSGGDIQFKISSGNAAFTINNTNCSFTALPQCSAVPNTGNQLCNKTYVDGNFVNTTGAQSGIAGDKTFTGTIFGNAADFSGQVEAGSFNSASDYRIKENVEPIENGEYSIESLRPVKYYNVLSKKNDIGFIAHELQEHLPFLVNGEKDGPVNQSINYTGLIPILVSEIQELKTQLKNTQTKLEQLYNILGLK